MIAPLKYGTWTQVTPPRPSFAFPLATMLAKKYPADSILAFGCLLFIATSFGAAISTSSNEFILNRFGQGISSGLAIVVAQNVLFRAVGENNRTFAVALWTSAISLAPVFGPLVGAFITQHLSWRWLFLINVPLIALSLLLIVDLLDFKNKPEESGNFGIYSIVAFGIGLTGFQYVVDFGEFRGWFNDPVIVLSSIIALIGLSLFFILNRIKKFSVFDLSIFKDSSYALATVILCLGNGMIFTSLVILPIWLQKIYGLPIIEAGLVLSASSLIAALMTPFIGKYLDKKYFLMASGVSLLATAISFYLMSDFTTDSSHSTILYSRLIAGIGLAFFSVPLTALSLSNIPADKIVNANSISMILRIMGSNVMVSLSFYFYKEKTVEYNSELTSNFDRFTILDTFKEFPSHLFTYISNHSNTQSLNYMSLVVAIFFVLFFVLVMSISIRNQRHTVRS